MTRALSRRAAAAGSMAELVIGRPRRPAQRANLVFQRELRLSVANVLSVYGDCVFQQMEMPAAERGSQQRAWASRRSMFLPARTERYAEPCAGTEQNDTVPGLRKAEGARVRSPRPLTASSLSRASRKACRRARSYPRPFTKCSTYRSGPSV
jgi:hypothetical protein